MSIVTIFNNAVDAEDHETTENVEDVCAFLATKFDTFPDTAKIYHEYIAATNDVTPHCEAEIERLQGLSGHFFVVIWPETGIEIAIIVGIVLAAAAICAVFLLRTNTNGQNEGSPNNELSDRQNKARPNERIPDIVGTVRSTLDLLAVPYKTFIDNLEYEMAYMGIGRGNYTILDCKDDTTPVAEIDGEYVAVYPPYNSPNSVQPAPQSTYGTLPSELNGVVPNVVSIQQSTAVNGQVLLAPNSGNFSASNNIAFKYGGVILCNDSAVDFNDYYVASAVNSPQYITIYTNDDGVNASDPGGNVHSIGLAGTYQVLTVSASQMTLSNPAAVNSNWNILATFSGQQSSYYHSFNMTNSGSMTVGPYILNIGDMTEVWFNFVAQNGLYYVDTSGNQHPMTVTLQASVQAVDQNNNPVGDIITGMTNVTGSAIDRTLCGSTLKLVLPSAGAIQASVTRITPMGIDTRDSFSQEIQWRDLYGVSPIASSDFGNITTAFAITAQTQDALSIKQRKLNMLVTRNLPTWINRTAPGVPQFSSTLYPTNNAADIICALALDPFVGRRTVAELNVSEIYSVADAEIGTLAPVRTDGQIVSYFGTFLMSEFCYTFDDSKVSFEESIGQIAQAINCVAYRSGSSISLSFEQKTENSAMLFCHRNKIPNSETRTVSFGPLNDYDSIEYDYIEPNAPNYPDVDTTWTLYFPPNQSGVNPKKVTSKGVRNGVQAQINGWRLYEKIINANCQTEFEATQEAALRIINDRVLVADNTRQGTQDGEITGQTGLTLYTSQPVNLVAGTLYTAFIQHYDDTVEALAITAGPTSNSFTISVAPALPLVTDPSMFARTTYTIIANPALASTARPTAFLISQKEPQSNNTFKLTAINYSDAYYTHDGDVTSGALLIPSSGYGPQGYTGNGLTTVAGTNFIPPARTTFNAATYNGSGLYTINNAVVGYSGNPPTETIIVAPPTTLTLIDDSTNALVNSSGTSIARILANWNPPNDDMVIDGGSIQVQYCFLSATQIPGLHSTLQSVATPLYQTDWVEAPTLSGSGYYCYLDPNALYAYVSVRIRSVRSDGENSVYLQDPEAVAWLAGTGVPHPWIVPVSVVIAANSPSYLTNADKIALTQQWKAELTIQSTLDGQASSCGVSPVAYDATLTAFNTGLLAAGAPSNWYTIWPDGTTSGPWTNVQATLSTLWANISAARVALQGAITTALAAAAQAGAYAASVAAAATDATTKMNAAITAAQNLAPVVVTGLPTLPSVTYPAGRLIWNTTDGQLYRSTGSAWQVLNVAAADISGTLSAAQIASVAASQVTGTLSDSQLAAISAAKLTGAVGSGNLLYNCDFAYSSAGIPSGFAIYNNGAISVSPSVSAGGPLGSANYWRITANVAVTNTFGFYFTSAATDFGGWKANTNYVVSFYARVSANPSGCTMIDAWNNPPATVSWLQNPVLTTQWQRYAVRINFGTNAIDVSGYFTIAPHTLPSGNYIDFSCLQVEQGDAPSGWSGPITASTIAANTITANQIAAGTITAAQIAADTITASQIAASAITSAELAAGSVVAGKIAAGTIQAGDIAAATITGDRIAANTITTTQIAANTITAGDIAANTITAGQIAAGAIGATQLAAGAICTASLLVTNFNNLIPNPNSELPAPSGGWPTGAYEAVALSTNNPRTGSMDRLLNASQQAAITPLIPCSPGDSYFLTVWAANYNTGVACAFIGWFNAAGGFIGAVNTSNCATSTYSQLTASGAAPAGTSFLQVYLKNNTPADAVFFDDMACQKMDSGSVIVDGTITASKIAAGAITANMITTGTLNAANVAVTNLNASNITTGTLSATRVLFADGTALTTASRVVTTKVSSTSAVTTTGTTLPGVLITGLNIPAGANASTAASANDTFNLFGNLEVYQTTTGSGALANINLYVDGVFNQSILISVAGQNQISIVPFVMTLTGLAATTHNFQFYASSNSSATNVCIAAVNSSVLCQRVF